MSGVLLGLPIDGQPIMCDPSPSPSPNMTWADTVASIFGVVPPTTRFNGSRLQLVGSVPLLLMFYLRMQMMMRRGTTLDVI